MKLSEKLDRLQELARRCAGDFRLGYLIALLAEHAADTELDEGFLAWVEGMARPFVP